MITFLFGWALGSSWVGLLWLIRRGGAAERFRNRLLASAERMRQQQ